MGLVFWGAQPHGTEVNMKVMTMHVKFNAASNTYTALVGYLHATRRVAFGNTQDDCFRGLEQWLKANAQ